MWQGFSVEASLAAVYMQASGEYPLVETVDNVHAFPLCFFSTVIVSTWISKCFVLYKAAGSVCTAVRSLKWREYLASTSRTNPTWYMHLPHCKPVGQRVALNCCALLGRLTCEQSGGVEACLAALWKLRQRETQSQGPLCHPVTPSCFKLHNTHCFSEAQEAPEKMCPKLQRAKDVEDFRNLMHRYRDLVSP